MGSKTRRIKIKSLRITKDFLEKLGRILEGDIEIIKKESETKIQKLIDEKKKESKKLISCSKKERESWFIDRIEHIKHIHKPPYSLSYSINSQEEELKFSSVKELLGTPVFPQKIKSMSFRVSHYDAKYVDISISFDNDYDSIANFYLSSEDESKILQFEKNIKELFDEYSSNYNWVFKIPGSKYFILQLFAGILIIFGLNLLLKIQKIVLKSLSRDILALYIAFSIFGLFLLFNFVLRYLYPYYDFSMNEKNQLRKAIKGVFWILLLGILSSLIYDVINIFS